ncbi:MAG: HK97 family phage prohead protease [Salaquimonas sp.]
MNSNSLAKLRETKFVSSNLEQVRLDGNFSGYASVYNEVDLGNDIVAPGAFSASLAKRGASNIRMLFQHNPDEPIGVWEAISETEHGLEVRGKITTGAVKGREVLELMRTGAVDGLSIGFRTIRSRQDPLTGSRRILEADLWEISVVTFPMQESARIKSVKSMPSCVAWQAKQNPTIREFERWLVRDAGLSRGDARLVVTKGYRHALSQRDAVTGKSQLASRIRAAASIFHP